MPPLHEEKGEPGAAVRAASSEDSDGSSHTSAISKACEATPEEEFARLKALADSTALGLSDIWDLRGPVEWLSFLSGLVIACVVGPPVGAVLFGSMVWEWADRGGGAFIRSGRELTGFLCGRVFPSLTRATQGFNERFVKDPNDAYMIKWVFLFLFLLFSCGVDGSQRGGVGRGGSRGSFFLFRSSSRLVSRHLPLSSLLFLRHSVIIGLGGLVPLMFVCCALLQRSMGTSMSELSLPLAYVYHLIRIGTYSLFLLFVSSLYLFISYVLSLSLISFPSLYSTLLYSSLSRPTSRTLLHGESSNIAKSTRLQLETN